MSRLEIVGEGDPRKVKLAQVLDGQLVDEFGRAKAFADYHRDRLYYVSESSKSRYFHVWDETEKRWRRESVRSPLIERLAHEFMIHCFERTSSFSESRFLKSKRQRDLLIDNAAHQLTPPKDVRFDADPHLLGVGDGVVDLTTGDLITDADEIRACHITQYADTPLGGPSAFKVDGLVTAESDWRRFVLQFCDGSYQGRLWLQTQLGSCLFGYNPHESFLYIHGRGGSGKSTLMTVIMKALGDHATVTNADTFVYSKWGKGIREDVADLKGRRLAVQPEMPAVDIDAQILKQLTGNDMVRERGLYQTGKSSQTSVSIVLAGNGQPKIAGETDSGWWRRFRLFPSRHRVARRDPMLKSRLLKNELSNCLAWLIRGAVRDYRNRYEDRLPRETPETIQKALAWLRCDTDHVDYWFETQTRENPRACTSTTDMYMAYQGWCEKHDIQEEQMLAGARQLGYVLVERGFKDKRRVNGRIQRKGIELYDHAAKEPEKKYSQRQRAIDWQDLEWYFDPTEDVSDT